jgi:hypothetical protein
MLLRALVPLFLACTTSVLSQSIPLGEFVVSVSKTPLQVNVSHPLNPIVWWTLPGKPFIGATEVLFAAEQKTECFAIHDAPLSPMCEDQVVDVIGQNPPGVLWINGSLCAGTLSYSTRFTASAQLELSIDVLLSGGGDGSSRGWVASVIYGSKCV